MNAFLRKDLVGLYTTTEFALMVSRITRFCKIYQLMMDLMGQKTELGGVHLEVHLCSYVSA